MPLYVYHCLTCGHKAEYYFPTIDVTKWRCEVCGSNAGEKLPAPSSFRLHNDKVGGFTNNSGSVTGG